MRPGTCKHWSCIPGGEYACAKGHDIRALVGGPQRGWIRRQPCHTSARFTGLESLPMLEQVECADYEEPTPGEIWLDEVKSLSMIEAFCAGLCPSCGGALVRRGNVSGCPECPGVYMRGCRVTEAPK